MKRFTLLILLFTISTVVATAQCLPDGITFTTQVQIDNFQTNYSGCNEIEGTVIIAGNSITNLNGLNVVTSIGGDNICLKIDHNTDVEDEFNMLVTEYSDTGSILR